MSRVVWVLALALLPLAVQTADPEFESELSMRKAHWEAQGIDSYTFKVWFADPSGRLGPAEIVVTGGKITSAHNLTRSKGGVWETGPEVLADSKLLKTIPQFFAVAAETAKSGFRWTLSFDSTYEFPNEIAGHSSHGDPFVYKVYDFVVKQ